MSEWGIKGKIGFRKLLLYGWRPGMTACRLARTGQGWEYDDIPGRLELKSWWAKGAPNRSSFLAVEVRRWGLSARGRASERGVEKGSGAGQPKNVVELLLLKKLCRFPPPVSHVTHYTKTFDITRDDKGRASTHILSRQYRNSIYSISNSPKICSVRSLIIIQYWPTKSLQFTQNIEDR